MAAPFGEDKFGQLAETFAHLFGTPYFIIGQTLLVIAWIIVNAAAVALRWDPYPFILLNLAFSTQAAYAAPLILLAQTRQADRDKVMSAADEAHREALATATLEGQAHTEEQTASMRELLETNTRLTVEIRRLTAEIHGRVAR
jgi:uncharacterized membrane protein